jgi:hypothetical protein
MEQNIYLNDFIEKFNEQTMLTVTIFPELYDEYIIPASKRLQNEVNENMLTLPSVDRENYLIYVRNRIVSETIGNFDSSIINKWMEEFNLEKNEFPFIDNEKIKIMLSTWYNQPGLSYEKQMLVKYMQKDFYLYAFYLESEKIVKLIDQLKSPKINNRLIEEKTELDFFKILAGHSKKNKAKSLFEALEKEKYLNTASKDDFINAFTGTPPSIKIDWKGNFGDLKTLINHSIEIGLIENKTKKWVVTSNIFSHNGANFDSNNIKDTAVTKNENDLKKIINSIN